MTHSWIRQSLCAILIGFLHPTLLFAEEKAVCNLVFGLNPEQRCAGYNASVRERYRVDIYTRQTDRPLTVVLLAERFQNEDRSDDNYAVISDVIKAFPHLMTEGVQGNTYFFKYLNLSPEQLGLLNGRGKAGHTLYGSLLRALVSYGTNVPIIEKHLVEWALVEIFEFQRPLEEVLHDVNSAIRHRQLDDLFEGKKVAQFVNIPRVEQQILIRTSTRDPNRVGYPLDSAHPLVKHFFMEEGHQPTFLEDLGISAFAFSCKSQVFKGTLYAVAPSASFWLRQLGWVSEKSYKRALESFFMFTLFGIASDHASAYWGPWVMAKTSLNRNITAVHNIEKVLNDFPEIPVLLNVMQDFKVRDTTRTEHLGGLLIKKGFTLRNDLLGC